MKNVKFEEIIIKDFMSIGDKEVKIPFSEGLNFITGYNEDANSYNGVGKTTIINAFFYCLFGTLYGDNSGKLKNADIINNVTGNTPVVKVKVTSDDVSYEIVRQVKPSKCLIYREGKAENQNFSIAETNEEIIRIVYGDSEVYSNIIIMDSDSKTFLLKEPSKKTKFIENVFSLGVFSKMHKDATKEFGEKSKELSVASAERNQISSFLDKLIYNRDNFSKEKLSRIKTEEDKISQYKRAYDDLKSKFPESQEEILTNLKEKIFNIKERLQKGESAKLKSSHKIDTFNLEIRELKTKIINPEDLVCRTCKRPLDSHNKEDIERENSSVYESISEKEKELSEYKESTHNKIISGISILNEKVRNLTTEVNEKNKLHNLFLSQESNFKEIESRITSCESSIENIKLEPNPYVSDIETYEKNLKDKDDFLSEIEEEVEVLNYVKYLCSPEGVKAHILSKIVDLFNSSLKSYLVELNSEFNIEFDQFFDAHITNSNGADVSYHSLSGGERKRVELACIFAFKEIRRLQSNININVSMMDELLDSALCSTGISKAIEILERTSKENEESIFIITHKAEQIEGIDKKTFNLVKKNGITSLE